MYSVLDLCVKTVSSFQDELGDLVAFEEKAGLSIDMKRVFVVSGSLGAVRGKHAHKELTQVLVCVHGACTVICDDGEHRKEFFLNGINQFLHVPPSIWAEQIYSEEGTVLMVLCDRLYDESDYIRNYDEFLHYRGLLEL